MLPSRVRRHAALATGIVSICNLVILTTGTVSICHRVIPTTGIVSICHLVILTTGIVSTCHLRTRIVLKYFVRLPVVAPMGSGREAADKEQL
jgi:hypothetical protein